MRKALLLGVAVALAFTGSAFAQETQSGTIAGQVLDPQGAAVPGATVTVVSPQGDKTYTTDSEGQFIAPFLIPGMYDVRVELTGFKTVEQKEIMVRLGQRSRLSFTLAVSQVQETVEVVGASPVIDLSSTTAGGVLDSDLLKQLPVGRNFTQTLYMVPGVSDSSGVGAANPSIGGASGLENNYIVDGINISSTGYGGVGVYSGVYGSLGTGVTTDFIKETQVKTAGFEAEYGQASGGVVNVVTKSGTNQFHGSLFGYWSPEGTEGDWKTEESPRGTVNTVGTENQDFGITAGGPLLRDRLFVFGAFNPQYQTTSRIAPTGFPLAGPTYDIKRKSMSYAGKVTWQANANHRFDFSFFGDPSDGDEGPQRAGALRGQTTSAFSALEYGGNNQTLRYDGILSPSWFIEASASRAATKFNEFPSVDEWAVTDRTTSPWTVSGGLGYFEQSHGENIQYMLKSTNIVNAAGTHQFRYGVSYEDIEYVMVRSYTGPPFTLSNGSTTTTGGPMRVYPDADWGQIYRMTRGRSGPDPVTSQQYLNWFAQDTWQLNNNFTIKAGIRWERQKLQGDQPICYSDESQVGAGDGTPGNEIGCEYSWSNNWSPRVGAIYDITGNGKTKLYANWGRFFVKIPNDLAVRALTAEAGISLAEYFDRGAQNPVPEGVFAQGRTTHLILTSLHPALFADNTTSTYTDEFLAGFEVEAAPMLNLGVRYVHRNLSTVLEDYAQATPLNYYMGFPGLGSVEYLIDNITSDLYTLETAGVPGFENVPRAFFEDPVHKYDSVEVTATKAYSNNWSLFASYRWSRLKGNFEGFYRSDNGQSDPGITSLFDFPTNDPSYAQIGVPDFGFGGDIRYQGTTLGEGVLPNDRPHQVKIYGTYTFGGLNTGLAFRYGSGRWLTALSANPAYQNAGEVPNTLRGGGIETVADGFQEKTSDEVFLDLHLDYTFRFGSAQRLILIADIFNLTNFRDPTWYDVDYEAGFQSLNPNYGYAQACGSCSTQSYNRPRQIRFGARFEW